MNRAEYKRLTHEARSARRQAKAHRSVHAHSINTRSYYERMAQWSAEKVPRRYVTQLEQNYVAHAAARRGSLLRLLADRRHYASKGLDGRIIGAKLVAFFKAYRERPLIPQPLPLPR